METIEVKNLELISDNDLANHPIVVMATDEGYGRKMPYDTLTRVFTVNYNGYVPQPKSSDRTKFLKGDGTWDMPAVFVGASPEVVGTAGMVPAPLTTETTKYLRGDGKWTSVDLPTDFVGASALQEGQNGLVPKPEQASQNKFLRANGTWDNPATGISDFVGTLIIDSTHNREGERGLVPKPITGKPDQFLKSNGTWSDIPRYEVFSTMANGLAPGVANDTEKGYFLRGDATWVNIMTSFSTGKNGMVPAPTSGDSEKFLKGDGTWGEVGASVSSSYDESSGELTLTIG